MIKNINLCEGHRNGFRLLIAIEPAATYQGTKVKDLNVILVGKDKCVQCRANEKARKA